MCVFFSLCTFLCVYDMVPYSGVARNLRQGVCKVVVPSPFPFSLFPIPPLRSRPLKYSHGVWGSAVSSPSGVWGRAPAEIKFGALVP